MNERAISQQEYDDFRKYLAEVTGIVLGESKHYLVSSRLNRLMEENNLVTYNQLLKLISGVDGSALREKIVDAMTTNETMWFRDKYPYEILKFEMLPVLKKIKDRPIKIWSSACSSGQEPFSISMIVHEFIAAHPGAFPRGVEIIGTDISSTMLAYSQRAIYDNVAMKRGMSDERKQQFFVKNGHDWEVKPEIKSRIKFNSLNLMQNYNHLGKFDIIFCRNVLIYFSAECKTDILTRMGNIMQPDAYLLLGSSETPTRYTSLYRMVRTDKGVIYQYNP